MPQGFGKCMRARMFNRHRLYPHVHTRQILMLNETRFSTQNSVEIPEIINTGCEAGREQTGVTAERWSSGCGNANNSLAAATDFFQALEHPFWNFHYTLTSKASPKQMALIGESRAADILANVLFPFWAAHELKAPASPSAQLWTEYAKLPAQLSNRRLETAATRLFGNDPAGKNFCARSRTNKGCSRSTKTFACRTIPIAHNARSRNKWRSGCDWLLR